VRPHDVVIIGGGFSGIYSAWRLAREGATVALIEGSHHLGGAMWSFDWRGFLVDPGTQNLDLRSPIGTEFYRDILRDNLGESSRTDWASTTDRSWSHGFEMPDFEKDDPAFCRRALADLASMKERGHAIDRAPDFDGWLRQRFGPTIADRLKPMAEKVVGHGTTDLATEAMDALGMFARPKLGSDAEMIALKSDDSFYDDRLGVTLTANDPRFQGRSAVRRFGYPVTGALRAFCTSAKARLEELGVTLLLATRVQAISHMQGGLMIESPGLSFVARRAFWTLPDHGLAGLLGVNLDARAVAHPVGVALYAFEVHRSHVAALDYLHDFSPARRAFRYNSCGSYSGQVRGDGTTYIMAEVPSHPAALAGRLDATARAQVWSDMRETGFVRPQAEYSAADAWGYSVAYTLPRLGWQTRTAEAAAAIRDRSGGKISTIASGYRGRHAFMMHYDAVLQHELRH
jgi:hypothetical protein